MTICLSIMSSLIDWERMLIVWKFDLVVLNGASMIDLEEKLRSIACYVEFKLRSVKLKD